MASIRILPGSNSLAPLNTYEKTYYSSKQVKELLGEVGLGCTIYPAEGTEGTPHPFEETSAIELDWDEATPDALELKEFCKCLSNFLNKIAEKMSQQWVYLKGSAFSGNSTYPINIRLDLEKRCSLQPNDFFSPKLFSQGTHAEPNDLNAERSDREVLKEIWESTRGADVHRYFDELKKHPKERSLKRTELTTALNSVVQWILQDRRLEYASELNIDFEVVIHEQRVLIETKIGDLEGDRSYFRGTLNQIKQARKNTDAKAIIVIPDYPDISDELNKRPNLNGILFLPISKLEEHLSGI
jgi:hypothetical protein